MVRDRSTRLAYSTEASITRRPQRGGDEPPSQSVSQSASQNARKAGIRLLLDRRKSGRVVTVITGLPGGRADIAALGREIKTACGTGGSLKGGALELQGDQRERVEALLAERGLSSKRSGG